MKLGGSDAVVVRAGQISDLVKNWISSLGKAARSRKRDMLEDVGKGEKELDNVEQFVQKAKEEIPSQMKKAVKGDAKCFCTMTLWLASILLYRNHQRPGAVANATLQEYEEARVAEEGRRRYKVIMVSSHKTGTTCKSSALHQRSSQALVLFSSF